MEQSFFIKHVLHYSMLLLALMVGSISFRRLSTGQRVILGEKFIILILAIWASIRIYYGLYSIPIVSVAEFISLGIQLVYVDNELRTFRKKRLFRILGVLFLSIIPIQWIFAGSLNYRSDSQVLLSLYLISSYYYCIIYRPVNTPDQILRWSLLLQLTGNFLYIIFADYLIWKIKSIELSLAITKLTYRMGDFGLILITISFLMAYFRREKSLQPQK